MSLLNVPFSSFSSSPILTNSSYLLKPLRLLPRTVAVEITRALLLAGVRCLAEWLTRPQNTGYEPNFYTYLNEEHTPINFPDSFPCRDDATIVTDAEDSEVPCSGPSSSSKQTAASRVPTMLGSLRCESLETEGPSLIDSRASIQATGACVDRESVATNAF